jgi:cation diffusion facilitator family transporter
MSDSGNSANAAFHSHVFLGEGHEKSERRTWVVIALCAAMMAAEIVGGWLFGSIALIADGLHMSTHAGALLLAALAYTFARRHADNPRFTFGTGKFGDLAGFTSAVILAMIALLIGWQAVGRLLAPAPIRFAEAIPIAALGLVVNLASVWLLSGAEHHHSHARGHGHAPQAHDESKRIDTPQGAVVLDVTEDGVPPRFRLAREGGPLLSSADAWVETVRPDGRRRVFALVDREGFLESVDEIPEPHQSLANVTIHGRTTTVSFEEHAHAHASASRDNNMRAAIVHVMADAAVSVAVIVGLTLGWLFG